jgi:hypothetical protein
MAFIKTSSTTGKSIVVLSDQEWVAQGIFNDWFHKNEITEIESFAKKLANDSRIKSGLMTKMAQLVNDRRPRTPAQIAAFQRLQAQNAARRAGQTPAPIEGAMTGPSFASQIKDPRTGRTVIQTPEQMVSSMQRNRFGDAARANYQRMQSMSPAQREIFMDQLSQTPQGRQALTQIAQFEKSTAPGMGKFVQRLDPRTGKPISQLAGFGQDVSGKAQALGRQVKGIPGQFAKGAPQFAQNAQTVGRGVASGARGAAGAARGVGNMAMQGLGAGTKIPFLPGVGIGGALLGAGGAYLGAKAYQYFRDGNIRNMVINPDFVKDPSKVKSALIGAQQMGQLNSIKGVTNSIDDAMDRLNATVVAAINKLGNTPEAQQLMNAARTTQQQGAPQ